MSINFYAKKVNICFFYNPCICTAKRQWSFSGTKANKAYDQIRLLAMIRTDTKTIYCNIQNLNGSMDKVRAGHYGLLDERRTQLLEIVHQYMEVDNDNMAFIIQGRSEASRA